MENILLPIVLCFVAYLSNVNGQDLCMPNNVTESLNSLTITNVNTDTSNNVECSMIVHEGPAQTGTTYVTFTFTKFRCSTACAQKLNVYKSGCLEKEFCCSTGAFTETKAFPISANEEVYIEYESVMAGRTSDLELTLNLLNIGGTRDGTVYLGLPMDYQETQTVEICDPTPPPTQAPPEPPTEALTDVPTDALTDAPTVAPTDAQTDPQTESQTEAETDSRTDDVRSTVVSVQTTTAADGSGDSTVTPGDDMILGLSRYVFIGILSGAALVILLLIVLICAICCTKKRKSKVPYDGMAEPIPMQETFPPYSYAKEIPRTTAQYPQGGAVVVHSNGTLGGNNSVQWEETGPAFYQASPVAFNREDLYSKPSKRPQVIEIPANSFEPVQQEVVYVQSNGLPRSEVGMSNGSNYSYWNKIVDDQFAFVDGDAYSGRL